MSAGQEKRSPLRITRRRPLGEDEEAEAGEEGAAAEAADVRAPAPLSGRESVALLEEEEEEATLEWAAAAVCFEAAIAAANSGSDASSSSTAMGAAAEDPAPEDGTAAGVAAVTFAAFAEAGAGSVLWRFGSTNESVLWRLMAAGVKK